MKIPRARVKHTVEIEKALESPGQWILMKEMTGSSSIQSARKLNTPRVDGNIEGLEFGVLDGGLYVRYDG